MKQRKTIAVIVGTTDGLFHSKCLTGLIRQAKKLDYNIAVFSVFTLNSYMSKHQAGEENIFSLLKSKCIVGGVFIDYSFWVDTVRQKVLDIICSIPDFKMVIYDNSGTRGFEGIFPNDRSGFEQVVNHLIEDHGYKKIYCLTGGSEFPISHIRASGYEDAMIKHGLEIKDGYVIYGDFWTMRATKLAQQIADGDIEKPDAVVCANDKSAVTLVDELIRHGVRVPDDVAVAGYDLGPESMTNDPSVTSCTRPDEYTGERCICRLHKLITGEDVEPDCKDEGVLVRGESCGCHRDVNFAREYNIAKRFEQDAENNFRLSYMQESLMATESYDEFDKWLVSHIFLIRNAEALALCLNKDWNMFVEDDNEYLREGYQKDMNEMLFWYRDTEKRNIMFDSADLYPPGMLLEERPVACFFNAIHFEDRCLGYHVVRFDNDEESFPENGYHTWVSSLGVSLEFMRMQERMQLMYNRAFANSVRDGMTGLYNRQGYEMYSKEVFKTAKERGTRLLVVVADLDNLKVINDSYGHAEGDNAITVAARALQTCCGNGEYCVRSGGDEFIIFGTYDYDNAIPIFYRSRIDGYLARYNSSSEKPYTVGMSTGFFIDFVDDYDDIDQCFKIADERMYANKLSRKKGRK